VSRGKVYVGAEAREDRVKNEAGQAAILHFATHGILNDASPMYSHLALAQGDTNNEDGLLEAWELARGRFGAQEEPGGLSTSVIEKCGAGLSRGSKDIGGLNGSRSVITICPDIHHSSDRNACLFGSNFGDSNTADSNFTVVVQYPDDHLKDVQFIPGAITG
jgi:CHAT domain